ncbi:MAG: hypothetical protein ABIM44_02965 [candidate division WOR-3 bacterium]
MVRIDNSKPPITFKEQIVDFVKTVRNQRSALAFYILLPVVAIYFIIIEENKIVHHTINYTAIGIGIVFIVILLVLAMYAEIQNVRRYRESNPK